MCSVSVEEVKKIIRSLLTSTATRITVASLVKDYKSVEGYNIPYKEMGYNSLLHFLHSIPDVLKVNGSSIQSEISLVVSEKTAHVNEMVMKQRKTSKGRKSLQSRKSIIASPAEKSPGFQQKKNDWDSLKSLSPFPKPLLPSPKRVPPLCKHISENAQVGTPPSIHTPVDVPLSQSKNAEKDSSNSHSSKLIKLKHRKLLCNSYKTVESVSFNNIVISSQKDQGNDDHRIFSVDSEKSTDVPVEIERRLQNLISKYPNGLLCTQLLREYETMYKSDLTYQKYGFHSFLELCMTLGNIHYEKNSDGDFILYDKTQHIRLQNLVSQNCEHFPNVDSADIDPYGLEPVKSKDWDVHLELIPDNVFTLGEKIENDEVIKTFSVGDTFPVVVSEIINPSSFWVYKDDGALDRYMNSMQNFYRDNKVKYLVPEFLLEKGLFCVVHTLNEFQRGVIVDLLPNIGGHVKVYLIDYGTLTNLPNHKIWFLNRNFSDLPAQVVRANLAGVQPSGKYWSNQSCLRFKDFLSCKQVFARVSENDGNSIAVYIAEKNRQLLFINNLLIEEGYALPKIDLKECSNTEPKPVINRTKMKLIRRIMEKGQMNNTSQ